MPQKHPYIQLAEKAIHEFVVNARRLKKPDIIDNIFSIERGCFVSLHLREKETLRGCIGTIEPQFKTLYEEIVQNGISAASSDPRFSPVKPKELKKLHISVDVLTPPEKTTPKDLDPAIFGLILSNGYRKSVLLPALEGVETVQKQIDIVKQKGGFTTTPNEQLYFYRFKSERYK